MTYPTLLLLVLTMVLKDQNQIASIDYHMIKKQYDNKHMIMCLLPSDLIQLLLSHLCKMVNQVLLQNNRSHAHATINHRKCASQSLTTRGPLLDDKDSLHISQDPKSSVARSKPGCCPCCPILPVRTHCPPHLKEAAQHFL